jgi:protein-L-isoaspartate(D-aspartate) O-methyltransferase
VIALMLEQAAIAPGHRVLEIGSGGYNAALMSELAAPGGSVTTIDIDEDVTRRARETLDAAGYPDVRVVRTDGQFGWPEGAPYDLVLLTVTADDIAPAWVEQLAEGGRIVVPLRLRGQTRSIAFDKVEGVLHSRSSVLCGFVSMQGVGAAVEQLVSVDDDNVMLRFDEDQTVETAPLEGVLRQPRTVNWSGLLLDREEAFSNLDLWLASAFPGYCALSAHHSAIDEGLVSPALRWGAAAVVQGESLAYLTSRPSAARHLVELGVVAHGPTAKPLADDVTTQLQTWDAAHRHGPGPRFVVHPKTVPVDALPEGAHLTTRAHHVTIQWP